MGRKPKPVPVRRPNPITNIRPVRAPTPLARQALQGAAKAKRLCPNKTCANPKIEDGVCQNCGTIIDESNIVAEVQFGENSSGAAVVQGSFVGADQGGAKSLGPAFRRAGGGEDREKTIREGKRLMQGYAGEHNLPESVVNSGMQIFKLAAMNNFIQGRRMNMVSAVCLYTACRKERPCRVMLIDFADSCQVNVFKLGHCFKALHKQLTISKDGVQPILPEDLIYRFAAKLEFGLETDRVAETAVRLVQRMSLDWMVMGRRPSGVCGACLILAARMFNFRRTVKEVVYIVKVTTQTLQKRLEEFKYTPSSNLTVEEFLSNQFLESAHDPPSFYEKTEAFQAMKHSRKRKRAKNAEDGDDENDGESMYTEDDHSTQSREGSLAQVDDRPKILDADGFVIPRPPVSNLTPPPSAPAAPQSDIPIDPSLLEDSEDPRALDDLYHKHGDVDTAGGSPPSRAQSETPSENPSETPSATSAEASATPLKRGRGRPRKNPLPEQPPPPVIVDEAWEADEAELEDQISEMINDPNTVEHAEAFATAEQKARVHAMVAYAKNPQREIPMSTDIEDGEFADDPEVANCLLSETEVKIKEQIWVNANKDWLRDQQQKAFRKKMAALGPPKATRKRVKKPRIGEGQTSAASSPAEAAVSVLKDRTWSRRINYDAIRGMFGDDTSTNGSAATSRVTSRAGSTRASSVTARSVAGSEPDDESAAASIKGSVAGSGVGSDLMSDLGDDGDVLEDEQNYDEEGDRDDDWRKDFEEDDL